jgi:hypothetical protein
VAFIKKPGIPAAGVSKIFHWNTVGGMDFSTEFQHFKKPRFWHH